MGGDHADQVAMRLTARQRAIVEACEVPRSLAELMGRAGVSHRSRFPRRKHLKPLLEAGFVRMTNPGNSRAPNQRYVLTEVGAGRGGALVKPWTHLRRGTAGEPNPLSPIRVSGCTKGGRSG